MEQKKRFGKEEEIHMTMSKAHSEFTAATSSEANNIKVQNAEWEGRASKEMNLHFCKNITVGKKLIYMHALIFHFFPFTFLFCILNYLKNILGRKLKVGQLSILCHTKEEC